jgi:hypothetical protein
MKDSPGINKSRWHEVKKYRNCAAQPARLGLENHSWQGARHHRAGIDGASADEKFVPCGGGPGEVTPFAPDVDRDFSHRGGEHDDLNREEGRIGDEAREPMMAGRQPADSGEYHQGLTRDPEKKRQGQKREDRAMYRRFNWPCRRMQLGPRSRPPPRFRPRLRVWRRVAAP